MTKYELETRRSGAKPANSHAGAHPWALAQLLFDRKAGKCAADSIEGARVVTMQLARSVRAERRRGKAGHWSYDLNRHIALAQALKAETHRLRQLENNERARNGARSSCVSE